MVLGLLFPLLLFFVAVSKTYGYCYSLLPTVSHWSKSPYSVYKAMLTTILQSFHETLQSQNEEQNATFILGHQIFNTVERAPDNKLVHQSVKVPFAVIEKVIDEILEDGTVGSDWVPDSLERQMMANILHLLACLFIDVTCTMECDIMGRKLHMGVDMEQTVHGRWDALHKKVKDRDWKVQRPFGIPADKEEFKRQGVSSIIDEAALHQLVEATLADQSQNVQSIPDFIERQMYLRC